jgi:hypothetical protein
VEHDLTAERARPVESRFELAVRRLMDAWLEAGRIRVSPADVQLAFDFLRQSGCRVEPAGGALVRLVGRDGRAQEMSREAVVVAALRRLAGRA